MANAIDVARRLNSQSVLAVLAELMVRRGVPDHIRSELPVEGTIGSRPMGDGPEFAAIAVRQWIGAVGAKTLFIEPFVGRPIHRIDH